MLEPSLSAPTADPVSTDSCVLSEAQAAAYIGMSPAFLRRRRLTKNTRSGPPFLKLGTKAAYLRDDLDAWLRSQRCTTGREEA